MMQLRPEQQRIANYTGGLAAVSAVPGSGKTQTLAALATALLQRGVVPAESDVLVVTFTTSAVDNIRGRIRAFLSAQKLPDHGYRVLTLHGLAHHIVRERPDLAGTTSDFRMDDELSGRQTMPDAAQAFIRQHADEWRSFLPADLTAQQREAAEEQWRAATEQLGEEVTRLAKNLRRTPHDVWALIREGESENGREGERARERVSPFLRMGAAIYERYERSLNLGGRLDFDDLIWRAIMALENSDDFRRSLGQRWPYILEDEAQDSTPLQEQILGMLSREHGNWVRVGDPNQAIMTTFTASDVRFFRAFLQRPDVERLPLAVSGRSAPMLIDLANRLADWVVNEHPEPDVRTVALSNAVRIVPTAPGDAQPNPPDAEAHIHVQGYTSDDVEVQRIARHAARFVLAHPDRTCAILTPTNYFGRRIVQEMESLQRQYPDRVLFQDQLRNSLPVRNVARVMAQAVRFCSMPTNTAALADLHEALGELDAPATPSTTRGVSASRMRTLLRSSRPERLMFPLPNANGDVDANRDDDVGVQRALPEAVTLRANEQQALDTLATRAAKWLRASVLPVDQLVLSVAQDVLTRETDLAIAHSLALSLRRLAAVSPQMQLADLARELDDIAANRQKYMSNALIESGFEAQPGTVTITTLHKAKGLEWDRVYLTSVDQREFPHEVSGQFRGELWFLGGHDPATEARKQLESLVRVRDNDGSIPNDMELLRQARIEYIAERLRLLYVGITRARRDLILSYSREWRGRQNELALAVQAVMGHMG